MYPTTRCGLGTATAPQSATACDHAEPSGGESMEEDLRAPAPRKPRNQTSKWDPQDRVGFSQRESITPRAHDLLHQHIQETAWVPGPSASSLTLWIVDSITLRVYRKAVTRLPRVRTLSDNLLIRRDSTSPCRKLFGLRYLYNVACHEP